MTSLVKNNLKINSTIGDLFLFNTRIDIKEKVSKLIDILKQDTHTPGVILMKGHEFYGMISRRVFFESMSQPFSLELYLNRTVDFLFENTPALKILVLYESVSIAEATVLSLERTADLIYDPVVVQTKNSSFKLLDIHQLLLAQSKIHLLTVNSLKEANDFKSEVLGMASHDLKNPLNTIMGFARMIKDESIRSKLEDPFISECSEMIFNSSQKMLELIVKLLDSSAIEASQVKLDKNSIDFIALLENIIAANESTAARKHQEIMIKNSLSGKAFVNADSTRLSAAIDNIISNAIKYSPLNSVIEISIELSGKSVLLAISDQGPGIKTEERSKLFGKFSKLSSKPTGGESSTGLGLYIAKQTILLHDGDIRIESEYGKGSTFVIELPISKIELLTVN